MRIDSVRAIKAEFFAEQQTRAFAERKGFRGGPAILPFPSQRGELFAPVALGITRVKKEYKLAIRVLSAAPWLNPLIEALSRRCRKEIEVRYVGPVSAQKPWYQRRNRPVLAGNSVGHVKVTAGTLGCFVRKRRRRRVEEGTDDLILSNNHVLADENEAKLGDIIVQPGILDGGRAIRDKIGELWKYAPLRKRDNIVDAAAAMMIEGTEYYTNWLRSLGPIEGVRVEPLDPHEPLFKVGRTTGLTKGAVSAIEVDNVSVRYRKEVRIFNRQIEVAPATAKPFSRGGDSGSLIVDKRRRAVGLLFAGNDKSTTYANPISDVVIGRFKTSHLGSVQNRPL